MPYAVRTMEQRPNTILGLTSRVARDRWQRLSLAGRFAVVIGAAFVSLAALTGARMALGGECCSSGCPSMRAESGCPSMRAEHAGASSVAER